ncbi:MAG: FAD-dependent oxidoreductase [Pseudomonadota bacterium]
MPSAKVAIIGAGMTGLTCASALAKTGYIVTVFDKGRGPGGRMSTRRIDGGTFDHGAQYMRPTTPEFATWLTAQANAGNAAPWPLTEINGKPAAFVGTPHTNALPQAMATNLDIRQSINIAQVQRTTGTTTGCNWQLDADDGATHQGFDHLVVTVPAPQVSALLGPYAEPFNDAINAVTYDRSMVAMLGYPTRVDAPSDLISPEDGPIGFAARDSAKPGRDHNLDCWVIHANAEWSLAHQDDEKASIAHDLLTAFEAVVPSAKNEKPAYLEGHRWRFAIVSHPIGRPCLMDTERALTIAGDYMLGPNAEHAFISGNAAADEIAKTI